MSGALARIGALFVEPGDRVVRREPVRPSGGSPTVVVLCSATRARAAAAGLALALAGGAGSVCAVAAGLGIASPPPAAVALLSARRAAARLHAERMAVCASGRLVWLADGRGGDAAQEGPALAAAASAELGRAAAIAGAPGALALPLVRTAALDRVLAWHAGIVVVPEPDRDEALLARALASLAELGRPVVAMEPPTRRAGALAVAGLRAPRCAAHAVAQLDAAGMRDA